MNYKWKLCSFLFFFCNYLKTLYQLFSFPKHLSFFSLPWSLNISLQNCFSFIYWKKKKAKRTATAQPLEIWQPLQLPFHFIHSSIHIPIYKGFTCSDHFFNSPVFPGFMLNLASKLCLLDNEFWCENHFLSFLTLVICSITTSIILIFSVLCVNSFLSYHFAQLIHMSIWIRENRWIKIRFKFML